MAEVITDWEKDPDAKLPWYVDWTDWLDDGESIVTSVMTVSAGLVKESDSHSVTSATVWLSGGTAGTSYSVANRIETSMGKIDERTIYIRVTNK
jgi:hypothetical protein